MHPIRVACASHLRRIFASICPLLGLAPLERPGPPRALTQGARHTGHVISRAVSPLLDFLTSTAARQSSCIMSFRVAAAHKIEHLVRPLRSRSLPHCPRPHVSLPRGPRSSYPAFPPRLLPAPFKCTTTSRWRSASAVSTLIKAATTVQPNLQHPRTPSNTTPT